MHQRQYDNARGRGGGLPFIFTAQPVLSRQGYRQSFAGSDRQRLVKAICGQPVSPTSPAEPRHRGKAIH
jgi:hypothetical protein